MVSPNLLLDLFMASWTLFVASIRTFLLLAKSYWAARFSGMVWRSFLENARSLTVNLVGLCTDLTLTSVNFGPTSAVAWPVVCSFLTDKVLSGCYGESTTGLIELKILYFLVLFWESGIIKLCSPKNPWLSKANYWSELAVGKIGSQTSPTFLTVTSSFVLNLN